MLRALVLDIFSHFPSGTGRLNLITSRNDSTLIHCFGEKQETSHLGRPLLDYSPTKEKKKGEKKKNGPKE